jgi:hypothetical protein
VRSDLILHHQRPVWSSSRVEPAPNGWSGPWGKPEMF